MENKRNSRLLFNLVLWILKRVSSPFNSISQSRVWFPVRATKPSKFTRNVICFVVYTILFRTIVNHDHRKMRRLRKRPTLCFGSQKLLDESDFRKIFQTAILSIRSMGNSIEAPKSNKSLRKSALINSGFIIQRWVSSQKLKKCRLPSSTKLAFCGDFNLFGHQTRICQ